ncbi:hypothetical protein [Pigmentiphaga kullae]|uniref:hypothetical protein n=1 Tax=Pigmentiphaga kullae TaxID=151784 RepID=UPI00102BA8EE|nr:hypothetical protein [Pigmentiphaga kullae]
MSDDDWNAHYTSPDEAAQGYVDCGDRVEGEEFDLVRVHVFAKTTYRIVNGRAMPVAIAAAREVK